MNWYTPVSAEEFGVIVGNFAYFNPQMKFGDLMRVIKQEDGSLRAEIDLDVLNLGRGFAVKPEEVMDYVTGKKTEPNET